MAKYGEPAALVVGESERPVVELGPQRAVLLRPAPAGGWGGALGPPGAPGSVFETYMNASKSDQLSRNDLMSGSRKAVWKESARRGRRPPWRLR